MKRRLVALAFGLAAFSLPAADTPGEIVSFKCGLAIDAVLAELDEQADNEFTQEAMARITEDNGEFVCISVDTGKYFVRLQSTDMTPLENRLVFTVDPRTYRVTKTFYGR